MVIPGRLLLLTDSKGMDARIALGTAPILGKMILQLHTQK